MHQPEDLRGAAIAMLDRVDSGEDGIAHAVGRLGVSGDEAAGGVGGLGRGAHLLHREGRPAVLAGAPAIVGIEFDDVGAAADLPPGRRDEARPVGLLRPEQGRGRIMGARPIAPVRPKPGSPPACADRARCPVDRVAKAGIGIAGALGAEVADRGEAGHQGRPGLRHRPGGAQGGRFAQHLVVPARLVIGVKEQVRMALDHARHQGHAGQVDHPRARRRCHVRARRLDPFPTHQHRPAVVRMRVDAVEDAGGAEQDRLLGQGRRARQEHQQEE